MGFCCRFRLLNRTVLELETLFLSLCWHARVIMLGFNRKNQCFCYFTVTIMKEGHQHGVSMHTKLYKFGWNTSANSARLNNHTDLNLGEVVYISTIYNIPVIWLNLLNDYDCYFWLRDSVNWQYPKMYRESSRCGHLPWKTVFISLPGLQG